MILSKKGTHVGMILSFVVFFSFIIFIYTTFEPAINLEDNKQTTLDFTKQRLIERFEDNLTTIIFDLDKKIISKKQDKYCFYMDNVENLRNIPFVLKKIDSETNKETEIKSGSFQENQIIFEVGEEFLDNQTSLIKGYYSGNFKNDERSFICSQEKKIDRTVELYLEDNFIFENKIINEINSYSENYLILKEELGIPSNREFSFSFIDNSKNLFETQIPQQEEGIFSEEIPIQYLDEQANLNSGFIIIRIW